jgi:serine/threonine protein kinase
VTPERWRQIEELYNQALERPLGQRRTFLEQACAGDRGLLEEVESLLAQKSGGALLDQPAFEAAPELWNETATQFQTGTRLGPYELTSKLGAGGMGEVYRARDTRLRRDVAIKVILARQEDPESLRRFEREARAASALSHPNICSVFDTGETDGHPYLVMELLEGETLKHHIGGQPMNPGEAAAVAIQLVEALEAAHAKGIIHRDIKPGNVMLVGRRRVKVLDFGLAKRTGVIPGEETATLQTATVAGQLMGTPAYMAPELLQGADADARSDLWAFGAVLYEMLSGRLPFEGTTTFDLSSAILKDAPPPLPAAVPKLLRAVVERCLAKEPERRFQSAEAAREALERVSTAAPVSRSGRRWRLGIAAALVLVVLAAGALWKTQSKARVLSNGAAPSTNQEANDLFEFAESFVTLQNDIPKARQTFEQAIALDPHFAAALIGHVFMSVVELLNGYTNDQNVLYKVEEELHQVEREAPDAEGLLAAQAAVYLVQGRLDRVPVAKMEERRRWSGLQSTTWLVILFMLGERNREASEILRLQAERSPLHAPSRMFLGEILRTEGDAAGAIRVLERVMQQAPGSMTAAWFLTAAYLDQGNTGDARGLLEKMPPGFEKNYMWRHAMALVLAAEGKQKEASRAMDEETQKFARLCWPVTATTADFYTLVGDREKAIEWLHLAVSRGDERITYFRRNPRLAPLRDDPRFQAILRSVEARRK